jgi:6-phosphogluconate dehydrogenase
MQIGIVGLGRMGANIGRRLMSKGHKVVGYDRDPKAVGAMAGAEAASSLKDMVTKLAAPRTIWVMLPAGQITEEAIAQLGELLSAGDAVIDGGNSFYKDDIRRASALKAKSISYMDVGTSGGVWGLERGYCMMIGGDKGTVDRLDPIFAALAPGAGSIDKTPGRDGRDPRILNGYMHCGPAGSGHFVKMIHNGIEYGLMQAYAEGFDILKGRGGEALPQDERFDIDVADVAEVWRRGSVVSSWLLDLTAKALLEQPNLDTFSGRVSDSGEGRWTILAAIDEGVPVEVLSSALYQRFSSRGLADFSDKLLSAMRFQFGGHVEGKDEK